MTRLTLPQKNESTEAFPLIQDYLNQRGVLLIRWNAAFTLDENDNERTILDAYQHELGPFMEKNGFQSADVVNIHPKTENLMAIREKFLCEHTHSEDEIRFFVDGEGTFWFHFENDEVAAVKCVKGDFLSVPKGYRHWFDLGPNYFVKAIRIFTSKEGWVPEYTKSGVDGQYVSR
jgi:1,2-dihydroxy-3-keto-5-methylthiopentene dioxygenase